MDLHILYLSLLFRQKQIYSERSGGYSIGFHVLHCFGGEHKTDGSLNFFFTLVNFPGCLSLSLLASCDEGVPL